ncbi:HAD family hydrolase [Paenibacillus macquariensis]|uniref:Hydrolase of the HAD superfamily n=1 Tax=Paenibacillus macquariensis TaxID=948756 RepID=A0ABY1KAW7_9BACL|nr:hypothetical protein [Paenibacillus macquariensis]MEC0089502.1 haloacid dehalogenase [Paenibacillus macquariensis]OAB25825.1 hypothetical protein PMSM_28050 [Paenibacillus macquariensis subsp. macquariensis]SIR52906.1 putative hydrolase of the HAD superfamily [Paenibacillus macquariensis]
MIKYQLVLDVAGVIVTNLSPTYWVEMSALSGVSYEFLHNQFKHEIRELLWTGKISEEEFWEWIIRQCPSIETHEAQSMLYKHLRTLPAFDYIPGWSEVADIHLLSNHRQEWLEPLLEPIWPYLKSITISSSVGLCKPRPEIYTIVNAKLDPMLQVMYIDDQDKNMKPAKELSWNTLTADIEGKWLEQVKQMLYSN